MVPKTKGTQTKTAAKSLKDKCIHFFTQVNVNTSKDYKFQLNTKSGKEIEEIQY